MDQDPEGVEETAHETTRLIHERSVCSVIATQVEDTANLVVSYSNIVLQTRSAQHYVPLVLISFAISRPSISYVLVHLFRNQTFFNAFEPTFYFHLGNISQLASSLPPIQPDYLYKPTNLVPDIC